MFFVILPEQISVQSNDSRNTYGPSFQLEVHRLLQEFTETDREEEATQVMYRKSSIYRYVTGTGGSFPNS